MMLPRIQSFALGLPRLPGQASFIMDYCHTCTTARQLFGAFLLCSGTIPRALLSR
jgi:hypothetical protein